MSLAALIPIKRFADAKQRLAPVLDPDRRARLAAWLADGVVASLGDLPLYVACDDPGVADWALARDAHVVWTPDLGLNGAVDAGLAQAVADGADHVIVAHADLALPAGLAKVARRDHVTIVPDRRRDGTNALALPAHVVARWTSAYGAGSFRRHLDAAVRLGCAVDVRADAELALDIDTPTDLTHPLVRDRLAALDGPLAEPDSSTLLTSERSR